jgi:hypothetical protein
MLADDAARRFPSPPEHLMKNPSHQDRSVATVAVVALLLSCSSGTEPASVARIAVGRDSIGVEIGDSLWLRAEAKDASGSTIGVPVTWTSDAPAVVSVTGGGLMWAHAVGVAHLVASAGGEMGTTSVTVLSSITSMAFALVDTVRRRGITVDIGLTGFAEGVPRPTRFAVTARPGSVLRPQWDPARSAIGVEVEGEGTAWVIATAPSGVTDSTAVTVAPEATAVAYDYSSLTTYLGRQLNPTVRVTAIDGGIHPPLRFTTSDSLTATVDSSGLITPRRAGTARITATAPNGVSGGITITVESGIRTAFVRDTMVAAVGLRTTAEFTVSWGVNDGDTLRLAVSDTNVLAPLAPVVASGGGTYGADLVGRSVGRAVVVISGPSLLPDTMLVIVTPPRIKLSGGMDVVPRDSMFGIIAEIADSLGVVRSRPGSATVTLQSSDTTVMVVDATPVMLGPWSPGIGVPVIHARGVGAGVAWVRATGAGLTPDSVRYDVRSGPPLVFSNAVGRSEVSAVIGAGESTAVWLAMPSPYHGDIAVTLAHSNPAIASAPNQLMLPSLYGRIVVPMLGLMAGLDTVVATAAGYESDTLVLTVTQGRLIGPDSMTVDPHGVGVLYLFTGDSAGAIHATTSTLVAQVSSSDTAVALPPARQVQAPVWLPSPQDWITGYLVDLGVRDTGLATIGIADSAGRFAPTTVVVHAVPSRSLTVVAPPTIGLRQRPQAGELLAARSGAADRPALTLTLSSTDPSVISVPPSVPFPAGAEGVDIPVTVGSGPGTAQLVVGGRGFAPDTSAPVVVGRPRLALSRPSIDLVGVQYEVTVALLDPFGRQRVTDEALDVALDAPDGGLDFPGPVHIAAGRSASDLISVTTTAVGPLRLVARDVSGLGWSYEPDTITVFPALPALRVWNYYGSLSAAVGQTVILPVLRPVWNTALTATVLHRGSSSTVPASIMFAADSEVARLPVTGISYGSDTIIVAAPGYAADTVVLIVAEGFAGMGSEAVYAGDSVSVYLGVGPGTPTAATKFSLETTDGLVVTDGHGQISGITVPAGAWQSPRFWLRAPATVTTLTRATLIVRSLDYTTSFIEVMIVPR